MEPMLASRRLVTLAVASVLATPLGAQVAEHQRPFDTAGRVVVLTPSLAAKLGVDSLLPPASPAYRVVRLYQRMDSTYVLEFVYGMGDLEQRIRYEATAGLVRELGNAIGQRRVAAQSERRFQDGRAPLIRSSIILGLGFYGWAVPAMLDVNDARSAGSLYLLTSSASFFLPYLMSRNSDVSRATAGLYWYGATRGIGVGLLAADLIDPDASGRTNLAAAVVGSVLGSAAGVVYGGGSRVSTAEAGAATTLGDLGAGAGITAALATGLYGAGSRSRSGGDGLVLGGLAAGIALGPVLARREAYGDGDPHVVLNGAVLGMGVATTALLAANNDNDHVTGASLLGGEVVGAFLGNALARRVTLTEGQGTITSLAMLGGGLLGAGLVYAVSGADADRASYVGAGTVGGAGAMLLVLSAYRGAPRTSVRGGGPTLTVGPGFLQLRF